MQYDVPHDETREAQLGVVGGVSRDQTVQSIVRALSILEALRGVSTSTVTELARTLGLHKSTIHRLLATLEQEGYVRRDDTGERYGLGLKVLGLAGALLGRMNVRHQALPIMRRLMEDTQETVHLGVLVNFDVICIESVVSNRRNAIASMAGKTTLAHVSSMGKALLASQPDEIVNDFLATHALVRLTPRTITDPTLFRNELAAIHSAPFALNNEEEEVGIRCIAAPIFDYRQQAVAALSVAAPAARLADDLLAPIGQLLSKGAAEISHGLGYAEPVELAARGD